MIRLSVPGTLKYRALVLRVVASSCKLLRPRSANLQEASHGELTDNAFVEQLVSAIGEAFNNVAIHGYCDGRSGQVHLDITANADGIAVCMADYGVTFDLSLAMPTRPSNEPDDLPESGMGLFIIRSFIDGISYRPASAAGQPNVLRLFKRFASAIGSAGDAQKASLAQREHGQGPTRADK
jgi:serine/threonine-protein kinase RsbW